jgi:phosphohistidine phosphatase
MKVYFLRHGIAADREEWHGSDFDRPLTREGRDRMEREAKTICRLNLALDAIVTSPLVRAKETAEIAAAPLKLKPVPDERLGPDFDVQRLGEILREHTGADALMLVGHEPNMSETIGEIVGGARVDLKKGGLACVELNDVNDVSGNLLWLIPPKILAL